MSPVSTQDQLPQQESTSELAGRVAVVTGAAGAIGSRTAVALAADGAAVMCVDIADPKEVADQLIAAGHDAVPVTADLRDAKTVDRVFRDAVAWRGGVDILVNMAGLFYKIPRVPFWEIDAETWDEVVESNLRTAFLCSKAVAGPMRAAGHGRIVNVSSNTAVFGMGDFLHYVSAKAGVVGMTRSIARELGPFGIAVNAVAPGLVHTGPTLESLPRQYLDQVIAGQCLHRPIEVEDVVNAVRFLSGDRARMITGQTLLVNGGASMGPF